MHVIQNYTLKKNVVKNFLPLVMALLPSSIAQLSQHLPTSLLVFFLSFFCLPMQPDVRVKKRGPLLLYFLLLPAVFPPKFICSNSRLPDSPIRGVGENIGKFGSLLCPFNKIFFGVNCRY